MTLSARLPPKEDRRPSARAGLRGTTIHFAPEAHLELHILQGVTQAKRGRPVSKQDCIREALDDWFEAHGAPRHMGTEPTAPSRQALLERIAELEAELARRGAA